MRRWRNQVEGELGSRRVEEVGESIAQMCYTIDIMNSPKSYLTHLSCPECQQKFDAHQIQTFCQECRSPLLAQYDLKKVKETLTPQIVQKRLPGIWRWAELLPVQAPEYRLSLGEGDTPTLQTKRLGEALGLSSLYVKDESFNPTGTFKARGLLMAVSTAAELGLTSFVIPTAGNAGGALAVYAAQAGLEANIFMPKDAPLVNRAEIQITGSNLQLVDGLITDAGKKAAREAQKHGWFSVSTFKEPYRLEGKKTMGLELAEFFGWELPDVIIYPTGGGTGLVGMWKAFAELETLGWIGSKRPRMVSVQASGCAPIVRAIAEDAPRAKFWEDAHTIAAGLRVPAVFADRLILRALRESHGTAVAVTDQEIHSAQKQLAHLEGIFAAPEGAATLAGLEALIKKEWIAPNEKVVLFNTGTGLKYVL